jgi:hypothetical protein
MASTMCVLGSPGEVFVLCHTFGTADAHSWVERIDPVTLETIERSPDLPAGPTWPGGIVVHPEGSLILTFGRWCHRLGPDLSVAASCQLPRDRPYNSLVVLPGGELVMKDIGLDGAMPAGMMVLEPEGLTPLMAEVEAPEPSVARLSADGDDVYVVGEQTAFRYRWDASAAALHLDDSWRVPYRTKDGQGYGWDAVIDGGSIWFLDDGEGSQGWLAGGGSLRGQGVAEVPLSLVRAPLDGGGTPVELAEVCGRPGGVVANPPTVDVARGVAVGFDSGNGVLAGFRFGEGSAGGALTGAWSHPQGHGCHMLRYGDTGEVVTNDHVPDVGDHVVLRDIETGEEKGRVASGSPVQSVLFPCPGWGRDLYLSSFTTLSRISVA